MLERTDVFAPQFEAVAGFEILVASGTHTGGGSGQDHVAGMQHDAQRYLRDLFCKREDHLGRVRVLLDRAIDPQPDAESLRIADLARWNDPGSERT